jgi:hypothetical protein
MKKTFYLLSAVLCAMGTMTACKSGTGNENIDETLLVGQWDFVYEINDWKASDGAIYDTCDSECSPLLGIEFTNDGKCIYTFVNGTMDFSDGLFSVETDTILQSFQYHVANGTIVLSDGDQKGEFQISKLTTDTLALIEKQNSPAVSATDITVLVRHNQ